MAITAMTEQLELLGKDLYKSTPGVITIRQLPTSSELEYVGSEDFDKVMLEKILPTAIEETVDFEELLEIDYQWILRCLRILNYGPYHTTNSIFCSDCGKANYGEYRVNLNTVECKPLPDGFVNDIVVTADEFIDFDGDIHLKLPTIRSMMNAMKDKAFQRADGTINRGFARLCYMIKSVKDKTGLTPVEIKLLIQNELSSADFIILEEVASNLVDYGLRAGGHCVCPNCGSKNGAFLALIDDKFFRPTLGDLREWKHDRRAGADKDVSGTATNAV